MRATRNIDGKDGCVDHKAHQKKRVPWIWITGLRRRKEEDTIDSAQRLAVLMRRRERKARNADSDLFTTKKKPRVMEMKRRESSEGELLQWRRVPENEPITITVPNSKCAPRGAPQETRDQLLHIASEEVMKIGQTQLRGRCTNCGMTLKQNVFQECTVLAPRQILQVWPNVKSHRILRNEKTGPTSCHVTIIRPHQFEYRRLRAHSREQEILFARRGEGTVLENI